jgi:hypothetical protein
MKELPYGKPKKRKKLPSIKTLKAKAWKTFSAYVRKRDGKCVTCGAGAENAGHFIHGHGKPTFFDERNCHGQCVRCNLYLSGNLIEYAAFMKSKYGWETVDALRELSHQVVKFGREYYEDIINRYKIGEKEAI